MDQRVYDFLRHPAYKNRCIWMCDEELNIAQHENKHNDN